MRYKNAVEEISAMLGIYRGQIDVLAIRYQEEVKKQKEEIKKMQGTFTTEYIAEYEKNQKLSVDYKAKMNEHRSKAEALVGHYLDVLDKQLNGYFNAPVRADFANKINSVMITGLQLSDFEFEMLHDSATSYMELRLLNQLAQSRVKDGQVAEVSESGMRTYHEGQVSDPCYIKVPDADVIYKAFRNYKSTALFLLENYAGVNAELYEFLESGEEQFVAVSADAYFVHKADEEFSKVMDEANAILPENKIKKELTEQDKKLIDAIIDPRYSSVSRTQVLEIANLDPSIGELFRLDPRYAKYFEEA